MLSPARLAKHPLLAPYFEVVHPIFWPILLWQLMKVSEQIDAAGSREALIYISWWGGVRIEYLGDKARDRSAYKPFAITRDWSAPMPAPCFPEALPFILPGDGRLPCSLTEEALTLAHADTS